MVGGEDAWTNPEVDAGSNDSTVGSAGEEAAVDDASDAAAVDTSTVVGDASATAQHAVLIWGYGEHWPSPAPTDTPEPFDMTMKALLEAKGLVVDLVVDKDSTVQFVDGKALFIISNSVNRANLFDNGQPRFKNIKVPGLVTKDGPIEVMGMGIGGAGGFSTTVGETTISIVAPPTEPLTAGLSGMVRVYSPTTEPCPFCAGANTCANPGPLCQGHASCCWNQCTCSTEPGDRLIYAFPGPSATKIATVVGQPTQITIFAYPAGAMMIGGFVAPAKRMGFFIHRDADYSDDGKKLFNAAVDYLLAP
jgi:hypothetical protein